MATVNNVKITMAYQDATKRSYTFTGVAAANLSDVKTNVLSFNNELAEETATGEEIAGTFVSANGSPCKMITEAKIISIDQEVVYSAS